MDKKDKFKLRTALGQVLNGSLLGERVNRLSYVPRWIIFCIDVFILVVGTLLSYFIIFNLVTTFQSALNVPTGFGIIILVNIIYFLIFRTYAGIIRHSTFIDGIKLLFATGSAHLTLLLFHLVAFAGFGKKIYLLPVLFIAFIVSFGFLFLFRIVIKFIFEFFLVEKSADKVMRTVIYGSDANAIFLANSLKAELPVRFKVVAFVNQHQQSASQTILDLPILKSNRKTYVLLRSMNAEALIIADKSLSKEDKVRIVEECLEHNFKVFTLPEITNWEDEREITRGIQNFKIDDLLERSPIVLNTDIIASQLNDKVILITGAAGSIGSEITRQVSNFSPKKIIILDQAETPLHTLRLELNASKSTIEIVNVLADIRNLETLELVFKTYRPNVVYHAAAYKHVPIIEENPLQAVHTNILGTKHVADLSQQYHVERFVMVSTDKAVNPSNVMGASKRIAEKYVQSLQDKVSTENGLCVTKFMTTRFGNVLGSNGSIVPLFTKQIQEGGPLTITHPEIIRYFMTIPEACQLVLEAGTMGSGGEIFLFDMGKPVKILDLAKKMIRLAGFIPNKEIKIEIIGLRPGEKLYEELLNNSSKTLPTHNEKIMIAQEIRDEYEVINSAVQDLISSSKTITGELIVSKMKKIVPEFKSMNSVYESLDIEVK